MDTPNWGLGNWGQGTTTEADGALVRRNLDGNPVGFTQGAFNAAGAGLQGAGMAMMNRGRPPAEMGLMGLAAGANRMRQGQGAMSNADAARMGGMGAGAFSLNDFFQRLQGQNSGAASNQDGAMGGAFRNGFASPAQRY